MSESAQIPLKYLMSVNLKSLHDLELACLNRSQQCLRAARAEWEQAVSQLEIAGVARWLIENRHSLLEEARIAIENDSLGLLPQSPKVPVSGEALPFVASSGTDGRSVYLSRRRHSDP